MEINVSFMLDLHIYIYCILYFMSVLAYRKSTCQIQVRLFRSESSGCS